MAVGLRNVCIYAVCVASIVLSQDFQTTTSTPNTTISQNVTHTHNKHSNTNPAERFERKIVEIVKSIEDSDEVKKYVDRKCRFDVDRVFRGLLTLQFWAIQKPPSKCSSHYDNGLGIFLVAPDKKQISVTPEAHHVFKKRTCDLLDMCESKDKLQNDENGIGFAAEVLEHLSCEQSRTYERDSNQAAVLTSFEKLMKDYNILQKVNTLLLEENERLERMLKSSQFRNTNLNHSHSTSLTGLQGPVHATFIWILSLSASICDIFTLVLKNFRLYLTNTNLALRFRISPVKATRLVVFCLQRLAVFLTFFLKWPNKEKILKSIPQIFKKTYDSCILVIDCFEVFIQRPSNLGVHDNARSLYKYHSVTKIVIGFTLYGTITYISKCLRRPKNIKGKLNSRVQQQGDAANQDVIISEEVSCPGAPRIKPLFLKGTKQLPEKEKVEIAKRLLKARNRVKRTLERLIISNIVKYDMPFSLLKHTHSILTICSAFTLSVLGLA